MSEPGELSRIQQATVIARHWVPQKNLPPNCHHSPPRVIANQTRFVSLPSSRTQHSLSLSLSLSHTHYTESPQLIEKRKKRNNLKFFLF